ncbi:MAG TPA: FixH family protein [Candidatus Baltobacteraceae bacterium]|nr:FixH family protein [Candidatus Baltobacteraceae bacterium]
MRSVLVAAALLGIAACGPHESQPAQTAGFAVSVSPGVAGEPNVIRITPGSSAGAVDAVVLDMPEMPMPRKPLRVTRMSEGAYEVDGVQFSMAGTWRVRVLEHGRTLASAEIVVR